MLLPFPQSLLRIGSKFGAMNSMVTLLTEASGNSILAAMVGATMNLSSTLIDLIMLMCLEVTSLSKLSAKIIKECSTHQPV